MPHRKRKDSNQTEIIRALEDLYCTVLDLSDVGGGCPDLLVARFGWTVLVEVKSAKGKLRNSQIDFRARWNGVFYVVRSEADAINMVEQETMLANRRRETKC